MVGEDETMNATFDIDWRWLPNGYLTPSSDERLEAMLERLSRCVYIKRISYRESASGNGYHVRAECTWDCELCRLAFDDSYRFMLDCLFRKPHQRNVLWRRKTYQKGDSVLTCDAGPWIEYEQTAHPRADFNPLGKSKITGAQGGVLRVNDAREGGAFRDSGLLECTKCGGTCTASVSECEPEYKPMKPSPP